MLEGNKRNNCKIFDANRYAALGNAFADRGEYDISAHLLLSFTAVTFALLSLHIRPNDSTLGTLLAGAIGLLQWVLVAEL